MLAGMLFFIFCSKLIPCDVPIYWMWRFVIVLFIFNFCHAGSVVWISVTAAGIYLLVMDPNDVKIRAVVAVFVALSLNGLWGPLLFRVFSFQLLLADAALVGTALSIFNDGIGWYGTNIVGVNHDHRILIFGPCSSFHNISLGLLCWVTLTKLSRPNWVKGDGAIACLLIVTIMLLNTTRLYLMALSVDYFNYWHDGQGAQIFAWATTFSVLGISLWGSLRGGRMA